MSENPYAAPKADFDQPRVESSPDGMISPYGPYRDVSLFERIILGLLGVISLLAIGQIYALVKLNQANQLPDEDPSSVAQVDQAWNLSDQIDTVDSGIIVLTIIFWCIWKNKSCKNAWAFVYRQQGREAIMNSGPTPGWAVGGYFVPILNLYKPYQGMAFIRDAVSFQSRITNILPYWWLTWLLAAHVGTIYLFFMGKLWIVDEAELDLDDLTLYNQSLMMDSASYFVSCLFAAAVIFQLSKGQKKMAQALELDGRKETGEKVF